MKEILVIFVLGYILPEYNSKEPVRPAEHVIPFMVYFSTRKRGVCVGTLVSRMAVLTAAVCVVNLNGPFDKEPINVITGTHYRHDMRGVKVQVTKIIIPKLPPEIGPRAYYLQKSAALLLLRKKVPDLLTEVPLRALAVDYKGEDEVSFQDECIVVGWHFFFTGPDFIAQPCHGNFGAPVICGSGRMVGMLMAPDAQWYNCTGYSVLTHEISNKRNRAFFECVSPLFAPEMRVNWAQIRMGQNDMYNEEEDVIKSIYDGIITDFSSSTEEIG